MKNRSIPLLLALVVVPVFAEFSQHIIVNNSNINTVIAKEVKPDIVQDGQYLNISLPPPKGERRYWLVFTNRRLLEYEMDLREAIWSSEINRAISAIIPLESIKLRVIEKGKYPYTREVVQFRVDIEIAMKIYIYYDYPSEILDGGYYYTIDLPSIIESMK